MPRSAAESKVFLIHCDLPRSYRLAVAFTRLASSGEIGGKLYLYAQACPLPGNGNYIDGHWDLWCIACDRRMPTLSGCESIYIPGTATGAESAR